MLQALESHFLTASPFLFHSLNTYPLSLTRRRLGHVLVKRLFWKTQIHFIRHITTLKHFFYNGQKTLNFKNGRENWLTSSPFLSLPLKKVLWWLFPNSPRRCRLFSKATFFSRVLIRHLYANRNRLNKTMWRLRKTNQCWFSSLFEMQHLFLLFLRNAVSKRDENLPFDLVQYFPCSANNSKADLI